MAYLEKGITIMEEYYALLVNELKAAIAKKTLAFEEKRVFFIKVMHLFIL